MGEFTFPTYTPPSTAYGIVYVSFVNCEDSLKKIGKGNDYYNGSYSGAKNYNFDLNYCEMYYNPFAKINFNTASTVNIEVKWDNSTYNVPNQIGASYYDTLFNESIYHKPIATIKFTDGNNNLRTMSEQVQTTFPGRVLLNNIDYTPSSNSMVSFDLTQQTTLVNGVPTATGAAEVELLNFFTDVVYTWDFGDGTPIYTGVNYTHNYSGSGPYTLCVTETYTGGYTTYTETHCEELQINTNGVLMGKTNGGFTIVMGDGSDVSNGPEEATAINELKDIVSLEIYPNPASNNFSLNLKSTLSEDARINIFNITGSLVQTSNVNLTVGEQNLNVNVNNLQNGMYIVQLATNAGIVTKKLTIKK